MPKRIIAKLSQTRSIQEAPKSNVMRNYQIGPLDEDEGLIPLGARTSASSLRSNRSNMTFSWWSPKIWWRFGRWYFHRGSKNDAYY
jgi:hypothetical protein